MSAPAGWYDVGIPGRLRWWDGTRWTEHECAAPIHQPSAVAPQHPAAPAVRQPAAHIVPHVVPAGWYSVPGSGETRWWDGAHWTAYRISRGAPRGSWYAVEPPGIAYAFGAIFIALALSQISLGLALSRVNPAAFAPLLLGIFWLSAAIALTVVRGRPLPTTVAFTDSLVQPLPGYAEGPGAAWIPLTPKLSRWWSGARWGEYIAESGRVRPTHGGYRAYRTMTITAWIFIGIGVAALISGAIMLVPGLFVAPTWIGIAVLVAGIVFAVVGAILFPIMQVRRPALLLPEHPPA